jgi:hypothetical protein
MEQQKVKSAFKSLTPTDSEYLNYMMGRFSKYERALPQPSLNVQSVHEVVTFELVRIEDLEPAALWKKLWLLLKPQSWLTVMVPLITIANLETGKVGLPGIILAVILVGLMVYANWQADLADHLEGWDRLFSGNNKSVLQKGWFTGQQLGIWSKYLLAGVFLFGIPVLLKFPWVLAPYTLAALCLLLLLPRWWRKSLWPGLSSFCIFLLAGPLLTIGIDLAFDGLFSWSSFFLGVSWGLWMSFVRQQKIFTKQWHHNRRGSAFSFLGLGFDRSKALMRLLIPTVPMVSIFSTIFVSGGAAWFFPLLVVHSLFVFWEIQINEKVQSSVGSSLENLEKLFDWHHFFISLIMIIGALVWKTTL